MAEATTSSKPRSASVALKGAEALRRFLQLTGYAASDVDGQNDRTFTFITTNGGKYQMNRKGSSVRTIQGPNFPKFVPPVEEEG